MTETYGSSYDEVKEWGQGVEGFLQQVKSQWYVPVRSLDRVKQVVGLFSKLAAEDHTKKSLAYAMKKADEHLGRIQQAGSAIHRLGADEELKCLLSNLASLVEILDPKRDQFDAAYREYSQFKESLP